MCSLPETESNIPGHGNSCAYSQSQWSTPHALWMVGFTTEDLRCEGISSIDCALKLLRYCNRSSIMWPSKLHIVSQAQLMLRFAVLDIKNFNCPEGDSNPLSSHFRIFAPEKLGPVLHFHKVMYLPSLFFTPFQFKFNAWNFQRGYFHLNKDLFIPSIIGSHRLFSSLKSIFHY